MSSRQAPEPLPGVDPGFAPHMQAVFGAAGVRWLRRLPSLLVDVSQRWSLTLQPPFPDLSYSYVAPATLPDGTPAVLKVGVPDRELQTGIAALRLYGGQGAVRLLEVDEQEGALLLERALPGTPLAALEDDERATVIAAGVMRALWRPLPAGHRFPSLRRWTDAIGRLRRAHGGSGPLPEPLFERAEALVAELLADPEPPVLLHGDFHHLNVLAAGREPWLAVDPKGVAGEPAYDTSALLYNPPGFMERPDAPRLLERRVDVLAELLGFERERIVAWGVVQSVLSACWSVESHESGWEPVITCGEILARLR